MPNDAFIVGSAYHKTLEWFYSGLDRETVIEKLKEILPPEKEIEKFGLVQKMFNKYLENPVDVDAPQLEYKFSLDIGVGVPLIGVIDRLGDGVVVEYKTSGKDYTQEDVNNIQTAAYSLFCQRQFGKIPKVIYSVMNKKKVNQPSYKPQILEIKLSEADLNLFTAELANFIDKVKKEEFEPNPDNHCYYCPFGKNGTNNCQYSK